MVRKAIGIISGAFVLLGVVLLAREPALEKAAWGMALVAGGEVLLVGAYIALALRQAPLSIWRSDFPSYREAARIARGKTTETQNPPVGRLRLLLLRGSRGFGGRNHIFEPS